METAHRVHGLQIFLGVGLLNHVLSEIQGRRGSICAVYYFKYLLFKQLTVFDAQIPLLELVVDQGNILIDIQSGVTPCQIRVLHIAKLLLQELQALSISLHPVARILLRIVNCHPYLPLLWCGHLVSLVNHFLDLLVFGKQFSLVLRCDLLALSQSELSIDLEEIHFVPDSLGNVNNLEKDLFRFREFREVKIGISQALHGLED